MKSEGVLARWLPRPVVSLLLLVSWLLLQQSVAPAHLLVACVLAIAIPRLVGGFLGPRVRVRSPVAIARLTAVVLWDIVVANLAVARIVLNPLSRPQPAWVRVPLDVTQPGAVVLLATIITTTPGTISCIVDDGGGVIWVHALDCHDAQAMAEQIKQRYERSLKEIFE